jgi:hypothetical protein
METTMKKQYWIRIADALLVESKGITMRKIKFREAITVNKEKRR